MASERQGIAKELYWAAIKGDIERLQGLLDSGAPIESKYDGGPHTIWQGDTPLHAAARGGKVEAVRFLLRRGADPNSRSNNGSTPIFHTVCVKGGSEVAEVLIEAGADVNARNDHDQTPLHRAARCRSREMADLLMARGARPDLIVAACLNDLMMARRMLESGTDVNYRLATGMTALHCASLEGHAEFVTFLIEHGADIEARDSHGRTPMHGARDATVARQLYEAGADVDAEDNWGTTPLFRLRSDVIEFLVSAGADVNHVDQLGRTPLSVLAWAGQREPARLLIEHGAEVDLQITAGLGMLEEARGLLDAGADVDEPGHGGNTALHLAAMHGLKEMIRLLIDRGADVNATNTKGETPLHLLTNLGVFGPSAEDSVEMARMLLDQGAYADARDNEGELPILWAIDQGPQELVELLAQHMSEEAKSSIAHLLNR